MERIDDLVADWPDPARASLAVVRPDGIVASGGDVDRVSRIASISKVVAALAALIAVEEGTLALAAAAGPPGATVRHLLAHASGLDFRENRVLAGVGEKRIYSNVGIEMLADHLAERAAMSFEEYQRLAVLEPLAMGASELRGSPADSLYSSVADLSLLAGELLRPTLVASATLAEATTPQFPDLAGVLPGVGRFDPNPWGLGVEIRGGKSPHWTGAGNSPATFGHFGGTGTFLWVDPDRDLAVVAVSGTEFDTWALEAWPRAADEILHRFG